MSRGGLKGCLLSIIVFPATILLALLNFLQDAIERLLDAYFPEDDEG